MPWSTAAAEMTAAHAAELGEATEYKHLALLLPVAVTAVWGEAVPVDAGFGVVAYQRDVVFPLAGCADEFGAAVTPVNAGWLLRRPGEAVSGTDERWDVFSVQIDDGAYTLRVQRGA